MAVSREVRLVRPLAGGLLAEADFDVVGVDVAAASVGEVEVENLFMSVDPYMRESALPGQSMIPSELVFVPGEPLAGPAVGRVKASRYAGLEPGDLVHSMLGWRERFTAPGERLQRIEESGFPPQLYLGALGITGLTAWVGVRMARIEQSETVFISAAAGAVGSIACQLAKLKGARVIGSTGGAQKAAFLRELGVDDVIDYRRASDLRAELSAVAPDGLDVYFDNVGGLHLEAAVAATRPHARIILCGKLSEHEERDAAARPDLWLAVPRSLSFLGFSVRYHLHELDAFRQEVGPLLRSGVIRAHDTTEHGIEAAPRALVRMLAGDKLGKMLVQLGS